MKFRMLSLALALLVFAALGFSQPTTIFNVQYLPGGDNFPLTLEGTTDGTGTPIPLGTHVKWFIDVGQDGDQGNDVQPTVGADNYDWNANDFYTDNLFGSYPDGFFYQFETFTTVGGTPANTSVYMVVCCPETDQPLYYSARFALAATGGQVQGIITCPTTGNDPCWTPYGPCTAACEGTQSPFTLAETPGGHGGDEPSEYYCLNLCSDPLEIVIGPLRPYEFPVGSFMAGCTPNPTDGSGCDVQCDPASFDWDGQWVYNETDGSFHATIFPTAPGCVCFTLDDILAAELLSSAFEPGDKNVTVSWSTASEIDLSHFELTRARAGQDAEVIATVPAKGSEGSGDDYSYVDASVNNGVSYDYSLVEVDVNGNKTVMATEDGVTPNANLAVISEYALHQNYPNPFNPTTNIVFDVVEENHVELTVYNAVGQLVATVANGVYGNGRHTVEFSSDNLTSGLYFYTIKIGNEFSATKKMLLVK
jgi:hypothetical protein